MLQKVAGGDGPGVQESRDGVIASDKCAERQIDVDRRGEGGAGEGDGEGEEEDAEESRRAQETVGIAVRAVRGWRRGGVDHGGRVAWLVLAVKVGK